MKMKSFYLFGVMIIGLINFPGIFFNIFKGEHNSTDNLAKKEEITKDNLENELGFPVINEDISLTKPLSFSDRTLFDQTNESWSDKFGPSSSFYNPCNWVSSEIDSIAVTENGNMYAAWGLDLYNGTIIIERLIVTKWEDNKWVTLGDPNQQPSGNYASSIIVDSEGNLYVLAVYASTNARYLYKWDGRQWTFLTRADFGEMIMDSQGKIYFVGRYNLFEWNGSEFLALAELQGEIYDVKLDSNDVPYIAGEFYTPTSEKFYVAKLNEGTWQPLGAEVFYDSPVHEMFIDDMNRVYAAAGDFQSSLIAQWDGQTWRLMAPDFFAYNPMYITKIFQDENGVITVFVPGNGIFLKWDGTTWNYVQAKWDHLLGYILDIFISKNQTIYAYGNLEEDAVIIWDGDQWNQLVSIGIPYYGFDDVVLSVVTDQNNTVYASTGSCVAQWDGSQWQKYDLWQWGEIQIIELDLEGNLFAASKTTVAKWDGSQWQVFDDSLSGINTLYFDSNNTLYIGARSSDLLGYNVFRWDSQSENWVAIGEVFDGPIETIITDDSGYLYAGGDFNRVGETAINKVVKWNGGAWDTIGTGLGTVYSLGFNAIGNLFASSYMGIYQWDGINWNLLGTDIEKSVYSSKSLVFDTKGNLYASGEINENGDYPCILAKWDGIQWTNLGYIKGSVNDMTIDASENLYLGGHFLTVDNTVSVNFARYNINQAEDPAKDWLLMYYLAGDNDLSPRMEEVTRIISNTVNKNVNIVIFEDLATAPSSYIAINSAGTTNIPKGELNTGDPNTLSDFISWSKTNYPAKHTLLTIVDHGNALSGVAFDDSSLFGLDHLSPPDLKQALSSAGKVDVLHMFACLMANLEAQYQLRGLTDYYVGSENIGYLDRDPFSVYIPKINTSASPRELAIEIATSYYDLQKRVPSNISVVDMAKIDNVAQKTSTLADVIRANWLNRALFVWGVTDSSILQRFDSTGNFVIDNDDVLADLYDFAFLLSTASEFTPAANDLMDAIDEYVIYNKSSSGPFEYKGKRYSYYLYDSHGVSIGLPRSSISYYNPSWLDFAEGANWIISPKIATTVQSDTQAGFSWGAFVSDLVKEFNPGAPDSPNPPDLVSLLTGENHSIFLPLIIR